MANLSERKIAERVKLSAKKRLPLKDNWSSDNEYYKQVENRVKLSEGFTKATSARDAKDFPVACFCRYDYKVWRNSNVENVEFSSEIDYFFVSLAFPMSFLNVRAECFHWKQRCSLKTPPVMLAERVLFSKVSVPHSI